MSILDRAERVANIVVLGIIAYWIFYVCRCIVASAQIN